MTRLDRKSAWKSNSDDSEITPSSWEGWFVAEGISANFRAGLGFSFGVSHFEGRTFNAQQQNYQEDAIHNYDIFKAIYLYQYENEKQDDWWGASLDFGLGVGTPSMGVNLPFPTFYKCLSSQKKLVDISYLEKIERWFDFIPIVGQIDDLLYFLFEYLPQKIK